MLVAHTDYYQLIIAPSAFLFSTVHYFTPANSRHPLPPTSTLLVMQWFVWVHATCMMTAVFFILPLGILTARYRITPTKLLSFLPPLLRSRIPPLSTSLLADAAAPQPSWLLLHSTLLFFSGFLLLIGAACMFISLDHHLSSVHSWLGIFIVVMTVFVQPKDVSTAAQMDVDQHRNTGWLLYALCYLNIGLGLYLVASRGPAAAHKA